MNLRISLTIVLFFIVTHLFSQYEAYSVDSVSSINDESPLIIDLDSLLEGKVEKGVLSKINTPKFVNTPRMSNRKLKSKELKESLGNQAFDSLLIANKNLQEQDIEPQEIDFWKNAPLVSIDSLVLKANPFFIELVYMGLPYKFNLNTELDFQTLYFEYKAKTITSSYLPLFEVQSPELFIYTLRRDGRDEITRTAANLYAFSFEELPDPSRLKNQKITQHRLDKVKFVDEDESYTNDKKLNLKKIIPSSWFHKSSALAQFSQNSVSSNWYQGGTSNLSVLGILQGKLNYDNKKNIQWDNSAEWRMGFNTVSGDTLRSLSTNDDVLKLNSKLGIKASGNWFYSGSVDFSTQFFNSYKGINSTVMKASFLTPIRLNIGFGFDYKYKKIFSLMFSPVAYKYIYIYDDLKVDPNLFGIDLGKNVLSEVGSSFKAILSLPISREIQLDSKLSFYTNYKKVEIDWEVVCNITINRFMSTRISLNPRYDNTVIEKNGDKAQVQYKQLLSVGFSHKFK